MLLKFLRACRVKLAGMDGTPRESNGYIGFAYDRRSEGPLPRSQIDYISSARTNRSEERVPSHSVPAHILGYERHVLVLRVCGRDTDKQKRRRERERERVAQERKEWGKVLRR